MSGRAGYGLMSYLRFLKAEFLEELSEECSLDDV